MPRGTWRSRRQEAHSRPFNIHVNIRPERAIGMPSQIFKKNSPEGVAAQRALRCDTGKHLMPEIVAPNQRALTTSGDFIVSTTIRAIEPLDGGDVIESGL